MSMSSFKVEIKHDFKVDRKWLVLRSTVLILAMSTLISYYFSVDLELNLDFQPNNVCQKGFSTL